ncbi:MAG: hypothetical protein ACRDL6_12900 [Solirubrobacterales bacterium]
MGLIVALCTAGIVACGGGERQDEDEPEGDFPVRVTGASFPSKQRLAQTSNLTLEVLNSGEETIPDLAVTVFTSRNGEDTEDTGAGAGTTTSEDAEDEGTATEEEQPVAAGSFSVISRQPGLAVPSRPVWILEQGYPRLAGTEAGRPPPGEIAGPSGAETAQTDTFSFGSVEPGDSRKIVWKVTPVQPGTYTVHYRVAAGLQGKAVAVTDDGSVPEGEFVVQITDVPPQTRVNDAGKVVEIESGDIIGQAGTEQQQEELGGSGGAGGGSKKKNP